MTNKILLLVFSFLITACTQASMAVVNFPSHFDNTTIIRDVAYGDNSSQKLDIYQPEGLDKKRDVIVFLYGGRWTNGIKEDYSFIGTSLAHQGFIVVIPDYRKYPDVHFPVFVNDSAKALAWTYDHIADYHGTPEHIFVIGHSAGAHIGALLSTDGSYLAAEGKNRNAVIRGFIGLAGPYSFTPDEPDLEDMFGPPENYPKMRATTYVDGQQPPMLLLWGEKDDIVKRTNLDLLEKAIHEKGGTVQSIIYPDTDHINILGDLTWVGHENAPIRKDLTQFINKINNASAAHGK